jgi:hypothetical protein
MIDTRKTLAFIFSFVLVGSAVGASLYAPNLTKTSCRFDVCGVSESRPAAAPILVASNSSPTLAPPRSQAADASSAGAPDADDSAKQTVFINVETDRAGLEVGWAE